MIKHDGNGGYYISASLANSILLAVLGGLISLGAYMILWNAQDQSWKAARERDWVSQKIDDQRRDSEMLDHEIRIRRLEIHDGRSYPKDP